MAEAEQPGRLRPGHTVTVEDVRQLMGASTPHFALQLRNRIRKLIAPLPPGDPVLWVTRDDVPAATRDAIVAHKRPRIYVLGPESAVSKDVLKELDKLGTARRIAGADPVANAIAFARYSDGEFGWNVVDPGHGPH